MFRQSLIKIWTVYDNMVRSFTKNNKNSFNCDFNSILQSEFFKCTELVLDENGNLKEVNRMPGENNIGMIAWKLRFKTPEFQNGREIIVIANDITFKIGSFGMEEDLLFYKASELARKEGIPRIYIAANSGARIGLAEELKQLFQIAWVDDSNPDKGIKYLYLKEDDYNRVTGGLLGHSKILNAELVEEINEKRYKITDIFGKEEGLGVENLRGSGKVYLNRN